jgi:hypothetical protein
MMDRISSVKEACQVAPFGNALHISCENSVELGPKIRTLLGDQIYSLDQIRPSLEDVFVALIDRPPEPLLSTTVRDQMEGKTHDID